MRRIPKKFQLVAGDLKPLAIQARHQIGIELVEQL